MNIVRLTPKWIKRIAGPLVPLSLRVKLHEASQNTTHIPWMVNREHPAVYSFKRHVLKKNPHLHRLVVHLTDHCNLNCRGCTHFSNIAEPNFADVAQFETEFKRLAEIFSGMTEIYLLGGEPLLHPDVIRFMEIAREAFPDARINLMSNGVLVPRMGEDFWHALHDNNIWLVCDLYPINLKIDEIERLSAQYQVNLEWTDPRAEFFKLPLDLSGSQDATDSFRKCEGVNNCVILRDGRLYPCAYIAYIDIFKKKYDIEGLEPTEEDSISIFGDATPYEIFDFLCEPVPWCKYCDLDSKTVSQWGHSKKTINEWLKDDASE